MLVAVVALPFDIVSVWVARLNGVRPRSAFRRWEVHLAEVEKLWEALSEGEGRLKPPNLMGRPVYSGRWGNRVGCPNRVGRNELEMEEERVWKVSYVFGLMRWRYCHSPWSDFRRPA